MFLEIFPPIDQKSLPSTNISGNTTLDANDNIVFVSVDASGGPITITLPQATPAIEGRRYTFKDAVGTSSKNTITLDGNGSDLIDGQLTFVITVDFASISI